MGKLTVANARERGGVTKNRPEVETIDSPKKRQQCETELIEFASVAQRIVFR